MDNGFVNKDTYRLTTSTSPLNVFALVGAGKMPAPKDPAAAAAAAKAANQDNEALKRADPDYTARFMVARNRPENDANYDKGGEWVGKASMSKLHRFEALSNTRGPKGSGVAQV